MANRYPPPYPDPNADPNADPSADPLQGTDPAVDPAADPSTDSSGGDGALLGPVDQAGAGAGAGAGAEPDQALSDAEMAQYAAEDAALAQESQTGDASLAAQDQQDMAGLQGDAAAHDQLLSSQSAAGTADVNQQLGSEQGLAQGAQDALLQSSQASQDQQNQQALDAQSTTDQADAQTAQDQAAAETRASLDQQSFTGTDNSPIPDYNPNALGAATDPSLDPGPARAPGISVTSRDAPHFSYPLPHKVEINTHFGDKGPDYPNAGGHTGVDFPTPMGTQIYAVDDGKVILAGQSGGYGLAVYEETPTGTVIYGHASQVLVHNGEEVKRGDVIARVGSTGRSTGPHLHLEYRPKGESPSNGAYGAVDPEPYLSDTPPVQSVQTGSAVRNPDASDLLAALRSAEAEAGGQDNQQGTGAAPPAQASPSPSPDLVAETRAAALRHHIDPDLFVAQIRRESGNYNPDVISGRVSSSAGAQGIAGIMPGSHPSAQPLNPPAALDYAAGLMESLLKRYGGDQALALAAYNAGPGAVDKAGGVPDFPETQAYVSGIMGSAGTAAPPPAAPPAEPPNPDEPQIGPPGEEPVVGPPAPTTAPPPPAKKPSILADAIAALGNSEPDAKAISVADARNIAGEALLGIGYDAANDAEKAAIRRGLDDMNKKSQVMYKGRLYHELTPDERKAIDAQIGAGIPIPTVDPLDDPKVIDKMNLEERRAYTKAQQAIAEAKAAARHYADQLYSEDRYQAHLKDSRAYSIMMRSEQRAYDARLRSELQSRQDAIRADLQARQDKIRAEAIARYEVRRQQLWERQDRLRAERRAQVLGDRYLVGATRQPAAMPAPAAQRGSGVGQNGALDWGNISRVFQRDDLQRLVSSWQGGSIGMGALPPQRLQQYMMALPFADSAGNFLAGLQSLWAQTAPVEQATRPVYRSAPAPAVGYGNRVRVRTARG